VLGGNKVACPYFTGLTYDKKGASFRCTACEYLEQDDLRVCHFQQEQMGRFQCLSDELYRSCPIYNDVELWKSLKIPIVCPLVEYDDAGNPLCSITKEELSNTCVISIRLGSDYRTCPHFSKWFWQLAASKIKEERGSK